MTEIIQNECLTIPLYHGTSTLFVDSIVNHGLGGTNLVNDWNLLELAREVLLLSETHLERTDMFVARQWAFRKMTEQVAGKHNWQHGDTYLSPAKSTAVNYATGKRFGSELLTYTLDFLEELIRQNVAGVTDKLFRRFPHAFSCLDSSPSPVLIEASHVPVSALLGEDGSDASENLKYIERTLGSGDEILLQQTNFRLCNGIPVKKLRFWLVNILEWHVAFPRVKLYEINVGPSE